MIVRSRVAAQAGQLELNVMMPLIAYNLIHSIEILGNTLAALTERYIKGITALSHRCLAYAEGSLALITDLDLYIGYLNAGAAFKRVPGICPVSAGDCAGARAVEF